MSANPDLVRREIIRDARRLRVEIRQIFLDVLAWNKNHRLPGEPPIVPDPYGELAKSLAILDKIHAQNEHAS